MAATLTTILVKMRQNILDLPADTEDRLVGWVNEAQLELESYHGWQITETTLTQATTQGTPLLIARPADWTVAIGDPWYRTGTGVSRAMEWYPSQEDLYKEHTAGAQTTDQGAPQGLLDTPPYLLVYPVPDAKNTLGAFSAAGEYQILVTYRARADTLAEGSDETNSFTNDPDLALYLEDYATGQALLFNENYDKANTYLLKAQAHRLRAKRMDKRRRFQSYKHTPRRDVHASRNQRRAV